jgi:small conductance mechanosensitive channel
LLILSIIVLIMGVKTTGLAALIAAMGFAVGMALSGTLQNFAGGILVLLLKPFHVGDYIQAQGQEGTVTDIKLFNTVLTTADNKTVIVPNGGMSTSIINNFSVSGTRRVEWQFKITYGDNYDTAKHLIQELLTADGRVMTTPPFFIAMRSLDESVVTLVVRAWVKSGDFWDVFFDMNEKVYKMLPLRGLAVPYNKLDVNVTMQSPDSRVRPPTANTNNSEEAIINTRNETKVSDNSVTTLEDARNKQRPRSEAPASTKAGDVDESVDRGAGEAPDASGADGDGSESI